MFGMFGRRTPANEPQQQKKDDPRSVMSFARMDNAKVVESYIAPGPKPKQSEKKPPVLRGSVNAVLDLTAPVFTTQQMQDMYDIASWGYEVPTPDTTHNLVTVSKTYTTANNASEAGVKWNGMARLVIGIPMITSANTTLFATEQKITKLFVDVSPIVLTVNSTPATAEDLSKGYKPIASTVYATNTTTLLVGDDLESEIDKTFVSDNAFDDAFTNAIMAGTTDSPYTAADAFIPQAQSDLSKQYTGTYASQYPGSRCEPIGEAMYYASGDLSKIYLLGTDDTAELVDNKAVTTASSGCLAIVLINLSEDLIAKHYLDVGITSTGSASVQKAVLNMSITVTVTAQLESKPESGDSGTD